MNRKSFIELTALLDVVLLLLFAVLLSYSHQSEAKEQDLQEALEEVTSTRLVYEDLLEANQDLQEELEELYGEPVEDIELMRDLLSRISMIELSLETSQNELLVNDQPTGIHILRESLVTSSRRDRLSDQLQEALRQAIDARTASSILFIRFSVEDREVYKYAYDFMLLELREAIEAYGQDKVILSLD